MEKIYSKNEPDVIITDYSPEYEEQYINLANRVFGDHYISKEELLSHVNCKNEICTLAIEEKTNKLIGFCIFYVESKEELMKNFKLSDDEYNSICKPDQKAFHVKSASIEESHRKTGLSFEIFERNLQKAKSLGFSVGLAAAWKRKDYVPAKKLLVNHGFIKLKIAHMLWFDDKSYKCAECNGPCKCDAVVYYKIL